MDTKTAIAELRSLGYSQAAIADSCGLSQGAISHILTGRRKDVRASTHERIIAALEQARQSPAHPEPAHSGEASHA